MEGTLGTPRALAGGVFQNNLSVEFPASDPWAVAVGGTALTVDTRGNRASEVVWSDGSDRSSCYNQWGSGGGLSQMFKRPKWQIAPGVNNHYTNGMRQLPDVSAVAYVLPVYYQNQWQASGGTSAATPIWATGLALMNEGLIRQAKAFFVGPGLFYTVNQVGMSRKLHPYFDVRQGNNLHYPATVGWDYATGLGTPNLWDFYNILLTLAKQP